MCGGVKSYTDCQISRQLTTSKKETLYEKSNTNEPWPTRTIYSMLCHWYYCFVCLSFSLLATALSVYFRFMSLTVSLVFSVPLKKTTTSK